MTLPTLHPPIDLLLAPQDAARTVASREDVFRDSLRCTLALQGVPEDYVKDIGEG